MLRNIKPVIIEVIREKEKEREEEGRKEKEQKKEREENTDSDILSYTLPNCQKQFLNYRYN